jgi:uncharacterized integral membrane protein
MRLMRRGLAIVVFVGLLVGGWRFAHENSQTLTIHYLIGETGEVTVWAVLLVTFLAGAALTGVLGLLQSARLRLETRRYRKAARDLESEVHQLRNLPLSTEEPGCGESRDELASLTGLERGG